MTGARTGSSEHQFDMSVLAMELWRRRFRIALVTLVLCALTYTVLMFVPKQYDSTASILVEPRDNAFARAADSQGAPVGSVADNVIMSSQVELIQSPDTLTRVIRDLDLTQYEEFGGSQPSLIARLFGFLGSGDDAEGVEDEGVEDEGDVQVAVSRLQDHLTVVRQRDSRVLSIIVRSQDRRLAASIANTIARAHVNRRAEQSVDDTAEATRWLEAEIDELRRSVGQAESAVARYRVDNDLFVGPNDTSLIEQQLADITTQITTTQERKNTARTRASLIRELLDAGQPIDGVSDVRESVAIQQLSERRAELQAERAQLSANLLPGHPEIQAVTAQIEEVQQQIATEGRQVADALEAEARIEENLEQSLRDELARLKLGASNATTSNVDLRELEREATAQRNLLETYLLRYREAASRTDTNAALPDVRIITLAAPALSPAAPRTSLIILAVAIVSVAIQAGLVLIRTLMAAETSYWTGNDVGPTHRLDDIPIHDVRIPPASADVVAGNDAPPEPDTANPPAEPSKAPDPVEEAAAADVARQADPVDPISETTVQVSVQSHEIGALNAAVIQGEEQTVVMLGLDREADCARVAEQLIIAALDSRLSVALVDAGSGMTSAQPGITDLAAGHASFGDVVTNSDYEGLSEVCWGTLPRLSRESQKPSTLIEALQDLYEVVIVMVGTAGAGSNLKLFSGIDGRLVLVHGKPADRQIVDNVSARAADWGFERQNLMHAPIREAEVA